MSIFAHAIERNSDTTSTTPAAATFDDEPLRPPARPHAAREELERTVHDATAKKRLENDTLPDEAATAKAAIRRAIQETRRSLGTAVDVRLWTKKSPWIAVGLAATAGLATAVLLRRGGKHGAANGVAAPEQQTASPKPASPAQSGFGATIAGSLFDLAKLGLETAVMSGIREATARKFDTSDRREETTAPVS